MYWRPVRCSRPAISTSVASAFSTSIASAYSAFAFASSIFASAFASAVSPVTLASALVAALVASSFWDRVASGGTESVVGWRELARRRGAESHVDVCASDGVISIATASRRQRLRAAALTWW